MKRAWKLILWILALLFVCYEAYRWISDTETNIYGFISILLFVLISVIFILGFLEGKYSDSRQLFINLKTLAISIVAAFLLAELMLRVFFAKEFDSYGERNGSKIYTSSYNVYLQPLENYGGHRFYINQPLSTDDFNKPEFHYLHKYNSLGLRDKEFSANKQPNEFRILGLGDSFTEGVGTCADSTWLKQLENMLNSSGKDIHYSTMNGGVHGSDLFFSYDLFIRCLLQYKPDLVILNLNSTDIGDIIYRGCSERFDAQGNFKPKKGPWWEFFFGSSYIVRLLSLNILHYDWQLLLPAQRKAEEKRALVEMGKKINEYQALAAKEHFDFLLILQPLQEDIRDHPDPLRPLNYGNNIRTIKLGPVLLDSIHAAHDDYVAFYYPKDGHFTTRGYALEASTIFHQYFQQRPTNK